MEFRRVLFRAVAGLEPQRLVKAPGVGPLLVGGKLHQTAVAPAAFLNRPLEDSPAETAAAPCSGHAHALDLPAPQAAPRQARNEAELQAGDDRATLLGDGEELVGVAIDGGAGVGVAGVERRPRVLRSEEHTSELQSLMRISSAVFCLQ